jgi:hypothetical protein
LLLKRRAGLAQEIARPESGLSGSVHREKLVGDWKILRVVELARSPEEG